MKLQIHPPPLISMIYWSSHVGWTLEFTFLTSTSYSFPWPGLQVYFLLCFDYSFFKSTRIRNRWELNTINRRELDQFLIKTYTFSFHFLQYTTIRIDTKTLYRINNRVIRNNSELSPVLVASEERVEDERASLFKTFTETPNSGW